jgi:uncharacterized LabA/DUF88 family protein
MIANVYIDGFNLYYGAIRNTPYRWLNVGKLCRFMLPQCRINEIKYYTALVKGTAIDPTKKARQLGYLRALRTIPNLTVVEGHFLSHVVRMPLAMPIPGVPNPITVIKTEEKGSDVNIAAHLLWDAFSGSYDAAVIISNDSDLYEPIRIAKEKLHKRIVIINPHKGSASVQLSRIADDMKIIKAGTLKACQFADSLTDERGTFHKPASW